MIYIYRGSLQYLHWKKGTYECIDMPCEHYTIKRNELKWYWARVLNQDTMNELVDDCLVTFEKFQKQYIIIPSLSLHQLLIEEKPFITVQSPPGLFNPEKETRCYLNATFQHLYYNIIFREPILKNQLLYHVE